VPVIEDVVADGCVAVAADHHVEAAVVLRTAYQAVRAMCW